MTEQPFRPSGGRHHVVVIGSGFGGLFATKRLKKADVDVTLIDRTNHHLFQPLLYQVATGLLASGEIAPATRQILAEQDNASVVKARVTDIDIKAQTVTTQLGNNTKIFSYDSLIVAAGAGQSYFGNDHFAEFAPGMKSIDDALEIRARLMEAFERADMTEDMEKRERYMTFTIVGAGPTGVELAGQIAEMANRTLKDQYSNIDPSQAKIILLDGAPQVLPPFGKRLGRNAQRRLEKLGVTVVLNSMVTDVNEQAITVKNMKDESVQVIPSFCKIWSAGVAASPLSKMVAEQAGTETDRAGRAIVNDDLTVGDYKNVFLVGDMANYENLPGVAQVAMQGGEYAAEQIILELEGRSNTERPKFEYFDKGSMATVARYSAVVKMGKIEATGLIGWLMWLAVHIMFLVGYRNRWTAAWAWGLNVLSPKRWQMTVTDQQRKARGFLE
ncbi:NAD(P)/FAD-dependent oxidoreductase [Corynebacterium sp. H128]|uniref:NAD(P)/FAD-dependent oxidoreductase n=1 Tax=unclassified Corynebacterium TaxID=2624378 RepID=UPI0030A071D9